ncbi:MAG: InlB B-repeat-containing protein, partial [Clostridia bacterium]
MKNKKLIVLLLALVAVMAISFAGCAPTTYDVSYVGGIGATGTAPTAEKYEEGKELTLPANTFVKEGYTFAGWSDGAKVYEAGSKYTVGKVAVVFTATWTKIEDVVGVAYGLVHGQGYVGQATVSVNHKGVVTDATLDEACFPSQVVLSAEEQAKLDKNDYTTFAGKHGSTVGYKTVKFGTYTLVGDGVTYKSGDKTIVELFADEVAAKAYFEAVVAGDVKAVLVGNKTVVLTAEQLLKSKNGYGGTSFNWAKAVEATTQYVIDNGFDATIGGFEINKDGMYQDNNGISTGATWVDIADYYTILKEAHAEAVKAVVKTASYFGYDSANDTVIKTTVSVDAKGKVVEAYLTEVQMPKNVVAEKIEGLDASDYVDAEVPAFPHGPMAIKHFYKTVKFGAYTLTFDATTKNYKCGDKTIGELFADEAVATDYHKAVVTNSITVVLKSGSNKKIMSAQTLSKNQNGYWTVEGQENTQWKVNV